MNRKCANCGHEKESHKWCCENMCNCNEFKPQNHSQQENKVKVHKSNQKPKIDTADTFNLSDKRKELSNYGLENTESLGGAAKFYTEENVKEFIWKLKEKPIRCECSKCRDFLDLIDTLAGDDLK